jgi:hypothetical protein
MIRTLDEDGVEFIFRGVMWLVGLCVIVLGLQLIGYDIRGGYAIGSGGLLYNAEPHHLSNSLFFHKTSMGMFFAQHIPVIATINPYLSIFLLVPMYWAESTAAYLGGVLGLLFFLWYRKRIMFWVFGGIVICGFIGMMFNNDLRNEAQVGIKARLPLWGRVMQDILAQPLGYGLDSFANAEYGFKYFHYMKDGRYDVVRLYKDQAGNVSGANEKDEKKLLAGTFKKDGHVNVIDHPHNEFLWIAYEVGVHIWVVLGFILYFIWDRFDKSRRTTMVCASMAILICLLVESMLQFPFHLARIGYMLPIALGIFHITTEE